MVVVDSETPVPPEYAATRRTRTPVRRWSALGLAWLALTTMAVVALGTFGATGVAAVGGAASLPDRIAGHSMLTASVRERPAGRAVALYNFGNDEFGFDWHLLALGADRDSYRRVRNRSGYDRDHTLLAPDGRSAMVLEGQQVHRVNLSTGREQSYRLAAEGRVRLRAISPDGTRVAYTTGGQPWESNEPGVLAVLDLSTGATSVVPGYPRVHAAAFAPDSRRLAVQGVNEIAVISLDGQRVGVVPTPPLTGLVSNVGWSPDGRLLALRSQETQTSSRSTVALYVSVAGGGARRAEPNPAKIDEALLGWTAADRVLLIRSAEGYSDIGLVIEEVSLADGSRRVVTRFSTRGSCERGLSPCRAQEIQLAQGLLANLTSRTPGRPDRGPLPPKLRVAVVVGVELVVGGVWLALRRRRNQAV